MKRDPNGPTARILTYAEKQPGGVIRWSEADYQYLRGSQAAQRDIRRVNRTRKYLIRGSGGLNYHMSLKRVLDRHFVRVEGVRGFYVLKSSIFGGEE